VKNGTGIKGLIAYLGLLAKEHPDSADISQGDLQCPWNYVSRDGETEYCCVLRVGHSTPHIDYTDSWDADSEALDQERDAEVPAPRKGRYSR
jgi:hypothetical protein